MKKILEHRSLVLHKATGGIFDDLTDDRLQFSTGNMGNSAVISNNYGGISTHNTTILSSTTTDQQLQQPHNNKMVYTSTIGNQNGGGGTYYPTAIHANYAITPAPQANDVEVGGGVKGRPQTLVVQRHVGQQKLFSVGGSSN